AVVGHVALDQRDAVAVGRSEVEVGDQGAAAGQQPRGGQADPGRGAGHHGDRAGEVQLAHAGAHSGPSGYRYRRTDSGHIRVEKPGAVGARYRPPRVTAGSSKCSCRWSTHSMVRPSWLPVTAT